MVKEFEAGFIFLSSGVVAGASGVGFTADGRIVHIPGNNPEAYRMVQLWFEMAHLSQTITDSTLRGEIQRSAAKLVLVGKSSIENSVKCVPVEATAQNA